MREPVAMAGQLARAAGTRADRARWSARAWLAEHPAYLNVVRYRHAGAIVTAHTQLTIDGFTRTASTFAVVGFQLAQPRPVRLAHHLHAPGQLRHAVRLGVPALLTVREPQATVLSALVRQPYLTIEQVLRAYARFHEALAPSRDDMVVADFPQVTGDLGAVIVRINERFGTSFEPFRHTEQSVDACFRVIELRSRRPVWRRSIHQFLSGQISFDQLQAIQRRSPDCGRDVAEQGVARPSPARTQISGSLLTRYQLPRYAPLRRRAQAAYEAIRDGADR